MTGSDFLQLDASAAPTGQLARWLADQLRAAIADDRLPVGSRLPSTRELAADLQVSRGVVTEAYQRLVDDGRVVGRRGGGSVVVSKPVPSQPVASHATVSSVTPAPAQMITGDRLHPSGPEVEIDLSPGLPDLAAFPRTAWLRAERAVLEQATARQFGYPDPQGARELREALANWLGRVRGIQTTADGIVVVAGVAQALGFVASTLLEEGVDTVAVEDPSSVGAREQLQYWGIRTPAVPIDGDGLVVSELGASPAVLVTPAHQFPFGVVLAPSRRRELLAWAARGGLVIEDDYDAEHRYDRPPVPALAGLAPDRVIYTGSISKTLAPAMRIGWLVPPTGYVARLVERKRNTDLGNPMLPQLVLAALMSSGALERHLRAVRRRHRVRRDAMAESLARFAPQARVHGIAAGLHLTITLPDGADDQGIADAALQLGVRVQPLSWHRQAPGAAGLVLGYAANRPDAIWGAIERLAPLL